MSGIERKLIKPESILIEQTALSLATVYYEAGRSTGLTSKFGDAKSFARHYVTKFIPKAVELLMGMLANDATPKEQRDAILDALLERANDEGLSKSGVPDWEVPVEFTSDKVVEQKPVIWNTQTIESALGYTEMLETGHGKEVN